jgi:biopolymer transport protein TolQ
VAAVFSAGMREWRRSTEASGGGALMISGTKERVERAMGVTMQREMERLEKRMTFLANTGSAAPFIGLFGTVWGIMNSFAAIAGMQNTNLAVVAPGIAEALFATAIGLVAAIPAVLIYNMLAATSPSSPPGWRASRPSSAPSCAARPRPPPPRSARPCRPAE